jgi:hypothetical protein
MFGKFHVNSDSHKTGIAGASVRLTAAIAVVGVFLGSPARSESVDLSISNIDNRTVTVTATDLNDGGKKIVSGQTLTHNAQLTTKMLLDKDNNGHVKFEAAAVDAKGCEKRTYEGKQLSRGFNWQVSLKCN